MRSSTWKLRIAVALALLLWNGLSHGNWGSCVCILQVTSGIECHLLINDGRLRQTFIDISALTREYSSKTRHLQSYLLFEGFCAIKFLHLHFNAWIFKQSFGCSEIVSDISWTYENVLAEVTFLWNTQYSNCCFKDFGQRELQTVDYNLKVSTCRRRFMAIHAWPFSYDFHLAASSLACTSLCWILHFHGDIWNDPNQGCLI